MTSDCSEMELKHYPANLVTSEGMLVCFQDKPKPHQLFASSKQSNGESSAVMVYELVNNEGDKQMAFCFQRGNNSFFPLVTDEKVDFKAIPSNEINANTIEKSFLFQWGEGRNSKWKSLKSVAKSTMYLKLEKDKNQKSRVTIGPEDVPDFRIKDLSKDTRAKIEVQEKALCAPVVWMSRNLTTKQVCLPKRKCKRRKMSVKN